MKILLVAVNARYFHSNLAIRTLAACARKNLQGDPCAVETAEYTINEPVERIFADIFRKMPDVIAFSCYIWNMPVVEELIRDLKKVLPDARLWAGGPEVSYDAEEVLLRLPELEGVMVGEGEQSFVSLTHCFCSHRAPAVRGTVHRGPDGRIVREAPQTKPVDMDSIPFVYGDMPPEEWQHRIPYYESSRGCPFRCSYCLSSEEKTVRFRSLALVLQELQFFLDARVPQVKFVDRTFNCDHARTMQIWRYLQTHDNGVTNFHFEIEAELLTDEEICLLRSLRPGQVQLEIGVQSTNAQTLHAVRRRQDFSRLAEISERIRAGHNVHQHLDLIAGLPLEDLESFHRSFNDVFRLRPEQLQLGFLKVLKGSYMEKCAAEYGIRWQSHPPYEVLETDCLSCGEILHLHDVCDAVDLYYNSLQYTHTVEQLTEDFGDAFCTFEALADFEKEESEAGETAEGSLASRRLSRIGRIDLLHRFVLRYFPDRISPYEDLLLFDLYFRENSRRRPAWAEKTEETKLIMRKWMEENRNNDKRTVHVEIFHHDVMKSGDRVPYALLFQYDGRDPLTGNAAVKVYPLKEGAAAEET